MVNNLQDFLKARMCNEENFEQVKRNTYKYTNCGAWITEEIVDGDSRCKSDLQKQYDDAIDDLSKIYNNLDSDIKKQVEKLDDEFFHGLHLGFMQWANDVRPNSFSKNQINLALGQLKKNEEKDIWPTETIGVTVGSIVEGVDWETTPVKLKYPFEIKEFWNALDEVEKETKEIWNDTHGCEDCNLEHPEYGTAMVNPDCKTCDGYGVVI